MVRYVKGHELLLDNYTKFDKITGKRIHKILERVGLHTCNKDQVKECERLSEEEIHAMCTRATEIFVKESNILIMHSPITVKASRSL